MRILIFNPRFNLKEKIEEELRRWSNELESSEMVFVSSYSSSFLGYYPKNGEFNAVIITQTLMKNNCGGNYGHWGMVAAAEAGRRAIPCFVGIEYQESDVWMYDMLHYNSVHTFPLHKSTYEIGFNAYDLGVLILNVLAGIPVTS